MRSFVKYSHSDVSHESHSSSHTQPKNNRQSFDFNISTARQSILASPSVHEPLDWTQAHWRLGEDNSSRIGSGLHENTFPLSSFSQQLNDDALLTATPDLEMPHWEGSAVFQDANLPDDVLLAISARLQTADATSANVFETIAVDVSTEFNVPVTQEQVKQRFQHDETALHDVISLLPFDEQEDFFALVAAYSKEQDIFEEHSGSAGVAVAQGDKSAAVAKTETQKDVSESKKYSFEEGSTLFKDKKQVDIVEDPEQVGHMIPVSTWRARMRYRKMVKDPHNPEAMITLGALRSREYHGKEIPDPQDPTKMIRPHAEVKRRLRASLVDDPRVLGEKILYSQRIYRLGKGAKRVQDTKNPEKTILASSLEQRKRLEAMVEDPQNPGHLIRQRDLNERDKNVMVPHPFVEGKMVKASSINNIIYRAKEIEDPLDHTKKITMGQLQDRKKKDHLIPDPRNEGKFITLQAQRSREYRQRMHNKTAPNKAA